LTEKPRFVDKTQSSHNVYANNAKPTEESKMEQVYRRLNSDKFSLKTGKFLRSFKGYYSLKRKESKDILTIIDFSLSSNSKTLGY
jgi:hypothetical protein